MSEREGGDVAGGAGCDVGEIRGEFVPDTSRQRALFERYREIDADTPPAYR